jgi:hypothetical protein
LKSEPTFYLGAPRVAHQNPIRPAENTEYRLDLIQKNPGFRWPWLLIGLTMTGSVNEKPLAVSQRSFRVRSL